MEENLNIKSQVEVQNKLHSLVKERQLQLVELKNLFDYSNKKLYKDVILLADNLKSLEDVLGKSQYRFRVENFYSLNLSLGKILDLNNSVKTILLSLKIFEEHENYLKLNANYSPGSNQSSKSFIYKLFEKNDSIPLIKNDLVKNKFLQNKSESKDNNYIILKQFYSALYKNDGNFWTDLNKYLNFQMDPKQKNKENQFKVDEFAGKLYKLYQGSTVNYYKFYTRAQVAFDLDFPEIVVTSCDVLFSLYNKLMDKICFHANLIDYITRLDNYIYKNFIEVLSEDLQKLSEYIAKREMDDLMKNLDKLYN